MSRLNAIDPQTATGKAKELLDAVQAKLSITPNITRVMAHAPAVLEGYLSFSGALSHGVLDAKLREAIALEVGEQNGCQYCVSAHTAIGKMVGLTDSEIEMARGAKSSNAKNTGALTLARVLVSKTGKISDEDFDAARKAGLSDAEITEVIGHVALNIFTNYFNNATGVEVDFPKIALRQHA